MIGPTGEKPISKLSGDRGGINAGLTVIEGVGGQKMLRLDFGTAVTFLAMTTEEAWAFGTALLKKAAEIEGR